LRHAVLPGIESRFSQLGVKLAGAALRFGEAQALLGDLARLDLAGLPAEFPLPIKLFQSLSFARAKNLLRSLLDWHQLQSPDERRLNEFVRQLQTARPDRHPRIELGGYALCCGAGLIDLKKN
jgi:tRNA(Ile)-lysidine synthase